jgi:hypothetical protein
MRSKPYPQSPVSGQLRLALLTLPVYITGLTEQKEMIKNVQHQGFPGGHPPEY